MSLFSALRRAGNRVLQDGVTICNPVDSSDSQQPRAQHRPSGASHSKLIRFGIQQAHLRQVGKATSVQQDSKINLVRSVFSFWQTKAASAGACAQNQVLFQTTAGPIDCSEYKSDIAKSLSRQKAIGLWSHVSAQRDKLLAWIRKEPPLFATVSWSIVLL